MNYLRSLFTGSSSQAPPHRPLPTIRDISPDELQAKIIKMVEIYSTKITPGNSSERGRSQVDYTQGILHRFTILRMCKLMIEIKYAMVINDNLRPEFSIRDTTRIPGIITIDNMLYKDERAMRDIPEITVLNSRSNLTNLEKKDPSAADPNIYDQKRQEILQELQIQLKQAYGSITSQLDELTPVALGEIESIRQYILDITLAEKNAIAEAVRAEQARQQLIIDTENARIQLIIDTENANKQLIIDAENARKAQIDAEEAAKLAKETERRRLLALSRDAIQRQRDIERQIQEEVIRIEREAIERAEIEAVEEVRRIERAAEEAEEAERQAVRQAQLAIQTAAAKQEKVKILVEQEKAIKKEINEPNEPNPNQEKIQIFEAFPKLVPPTDCNEIINKAVELKLAKNEGEQLECALCKSPIYNSYPLDEKTANQNENLVCYNTGTTLQMFHVKCFKGLKNNICPFTRGRLGADINPLYIFSIDDTNPANSRCTPFNNNYDIFKRALNSCSDIIPPTYGSSSDSSSSSSSGLGSSSSSNDFSDDPFINAVRDEREAYRNTQGRLNRILGRDIEEQQVQEATRRSLAQIRGRRSAAIGDGTVVRAPFLEPSNRRGGSKKRRKTKKLKKQKKRKSVIRKRITK